MFLSLCFHVEVHGAKPSRHTRWQNMAWGATFSGIRWNSHFSQNTQIHKCNARSLEKRLNRPSKSFVASEIKGSCCSSKQNIGMMRALSDDALWGKPLQQWHVLLRALAARLCLVNCEWSQSMRQCHFFAKCLHLGFFFFKRKKGKMFWSFLIMFFFG
jgi:hypothetical protein